MVSFQISLYEVLELSYGIWKGKANDNQNISFGKENCEM